MRYDDLKAEAMRRPTEPAQPGKPGEPKYAAPVTGEAADPRKCYELFRRAVKERDFEACWALLSRPTQEAYDTRAANLKMRVMNSITPLPEDLEILGCLGLTRKEVEKVDGRMFMTGTFQRQLQRDPDSFDAITRTEFEYESTWGGRAKVYFKGGQVRQSEFIDLVREGPVWRIDLTRKPEAPN
jgi:hypothetical protein